MQRIAPTHLGNLECSRLREDFLWMGKEKEKETETKKGKAKRQRDLIDRL
jgi:hypothetical protein